MHNRILLNCQFWRGMTRTRRSILGSFCVLYYEVSTRANRDLRLRQTYERKIQCTSEFLLASAVLHRVNNLLRISIFTIVLAKKMYIKSKQFKQYNSIRKKIATEPSLSLILLVIVAVFLICQLPRLVLNMAEFAGLESQTDK